MFSVEWQFVTIMYTYLHTPQQSQPALASHKIQNHAQSWNKTKDGYVVYECCYYPPIILINIDVTAAWLWPHPRGVYDHCRGIAPFVVYGPQPPPVSCL